MKQSFLKLTTAFVLAFNLANADGFFDISGGANSMKIKNDNPLILIRNGAFLSFKKHSTAEDNLPHFEVELGNANFVKRMSRMVR
jgi:hypothetical protein